ncbi:MAG: SDR family oxidoreductase [Myxococcota bacterium]
MSASLSPLSVRASFEGAHVLVTGVTGFLGKVWLGMLLHHVPNVRHVTVVIRAQKGLSARDRFERITTRSPGLRALREAYGSGLHDMLRDRVTVVEGDCGKPLCGLAPAEADRVCRDVDLVAHFAGNTDFMADPRGSLAANVNGAMHAADLAARTPGRRLLHVSTCFVAGRTSGEVPEHLEPGRAPNGSPFDPSEERARLAHVCESVENRRARINAARDRAEALGWPNIYTYTKGVAEHLLAGRQDVRCTLVRPAIVECARTYPFEGWNEGINTSGPLVWLFSTGFRHFPSRHHHRFDVIPVDTVARSTLLVAAAALSDRARPVYQLGSSAENPLTFRRAIDLTNLAVRRFHGRPDARPIDRWIMRHLDVLAVGADDEPTGSPPTVERLARRARDWLGRPDLSRALPPTLHARWGDRLEKRRSHLSKRLHETERNMRRIGRMLDLYRPFTHDHDFVFRTDHVRELSDALVDGERGDFAFDVGSIDWRRYWLEVQVPGLEKWSLPLLRGEEIPEDPPPPARLEVAPEAGVRRPEEQEPERPRVSGEGVRP